MADVLPQFDPASRTLKVRFELDNPDYALRPDMFVNPVHLPQALTVPSDAIIDSGLRKIVYVERGRGTFEPRNVETGRQFGETVAVVNGLEAGERIVVSGNFLIDSESRMKSAPALPPKRARTETDPVCGMDTDPAKSLSSVYAGKTYFYCSEECKRRFAANPEQFVRRKGSGAGPGRREPAS